MSPDFYSFERNLRGVMAAAAPTDNQLDTLVAIPDSGRPRLFKQKSKEDLRGWVLRSRQALAGFFGHSAQFETDDINIEGADLREQNSGLAIELKTGAVTDANVGLSTMTWALEDSVQRLPRIMSDSMRVRRNLAQAGRWTDVRKSQEQTMEQLLSFYGSLDLSIGAPPPPTLEHFTRCVGRGITKMAAAKRLLGKPEADWDVPVILHADWSRGWKRVAKPFSEDPFVTTEVALGCPPLGRVARARLRIGQSATGRTVLFYPNYKNSFQGIPAKHWVQTPCFHVWIDR